MQSSQTILWLELTKSDILPVGSMFLAHDGCIVSTFVHGKHPDIRPEAYKMLVEILIERSRQYNKKIILYHSKLSRTLINFPKYLISSSDEPQILSPLSPATSFAEIIKDSEALYGKLAKEEKCKLVFQAVYGGAHLLSNLNKAWDAFTEEWDFCLTSLNEPLGERISPEGDLYRVNLRAAKDIGIKPEVLFQCVMRSAEKVSLDVPRRRIRLLPQSRSIGIEPEEILVGTFHHSLSYKEKFKPAYRLLHISEFNKLLTL